MADRNITGFDFGGDGFPGLNSTSQQQQYTTGASNGPTAETYDPLALLAPQQVDGLNFHSANAAPAPTTANNNQLYAGGGVGAGITTSPLSASRYHHSPLMPPNTVTTAAAAVAMGGSFTGNSAAASSAARRTNGLVQQHHQQQQGALQHMKQQQHRKQQQQLQLQQHTATLAAGNPVVHRQPQQQQHHHQHHRQQLRQQQQQQMKLLATSFPSTPLSSQPPSIGYNSNRSTAHSTHRQSEPVQSEPWLESIQLTITNLSTTPLSGTVLLQRLRQRTEEVITLYLPCVEFLVQCQQDLRKGLQHALNKRLFHHMLRDNLTPRQFYNQYISNLAEQFHRKNRRIMSAEKLHAAVKEIQKLSANARAAENQGCEAVKNTFLGGMKDGESWGLRKWLSRHGGALLICNDAECILNAVQKLDRSKDSTTKLAGRMRHMGKASLTKLTNDIPSSYQEQSSAHPFLPFFHRLEAALRGISNFDPEDDDVICIDDDDEVEVLKAAPPSAGPKKRRGSLDTNSSGSDSKRKAVELTIEDDNDGNGVVKKNVSAPGRGFADAAGAAVNYIGDAAGLDSKPPAKRARTAAAAAAPPAAMAPDRIVDNFDTGDGDVSGLVAAVADNDGDADYMKALLRTLNDETDDDDDVMNINFDEIDRRTSLLGGNVKSAFELASCIDHIAALFESNQQAIVRPSMPSSGDHSFWDQPGPFAGSLRLFSTILKEADSSEFLIDRHPPEVDGLEVDSKPPYLSVIKHPLSFRDIVTALVDHFDPDELMIVANSGTLPTDSLTTWNMWHGHELLMAVDLVFLNTLAYDKACYGGKSNLRSRINKLRKTLWAGIKDIVESLAPTSDAETKRKLNPTRRGESSGFVAHKLSKPNDGPSD